MRIWMLVAVTMTMTACGGSAKRSHDLLNDVRSYNEGVRWVKLPQAATHILPAEREAFLDTREELEEELRIDDFEIMRLKTDGKEQELAKVQIKWTWHMDRQGIVKTTTSRQDWRRYGSRWIMLKEKHVRGDEMPGIKMEEDKAGDEESESEESESEEGESEDGDESAQEEEASPEESALHRGPSRARYDQVKAALRVAEKSPRVAE